MSAEYPSGPCPFEVGDIVMVIPARGSSIGPECIGIPYEIELIEKTPTEPDWDWNMEFKERSGAPYCPYFVLASECEFASDGLARLLQSLEDLGVDAKPVT